MKATREEENIDLWAEIPQYAKQRPWFRPPQVDEEMQLQAELLDGGGNQLIKEIEG